jgi:hypothetical protein
MGVHCEALALRHLPQQSREGAIGLRGTHNSVVGGQWKLVVNFTILARYYLRRHAAEMPLGP